MNFKSLLLSAALALSGVGAAHADQTWLFTYSGDGVSASGSFTTASAAPGAQDVLSISGLRNGVAILGLVPLDANPTYLYDNQFDPVAPHFSEGGLLLAMAGGVPDVNLYYYQGGFYDLNGCDTTCVETPISFSVTAVPEPATALALLTGLGLVGLQLRRRRNA